MNGSCHWLEELAKSHNNMDRIMKQYKEVADKALVAGQRSERLAECELCTTVL